MYSAAPNTASIQPQHGGGRKERLLTRVKPQGDLCPPRTIAARPETKAWGQGTRGMKTPGTRTRDLNTNRTNRPHVLPVRIKACKLQSCGLAIALRDVSVHAFRHEPAALADHCLYPVRQVQIYFLLSNLPSRELAWEASWACRFLYA